MPTGTAGDDVLEAASGRESFAGLGGVDTVSYRSSAVGIYASLATGQATPLPRVMPFGDSITYGVESTSITENGGYRDKLSSLLAADDLALDFVGSLKNGPASFADREHEGLRGKTIDYLNTVDAAKLGAAAPDIVLLMVGTNDLASNTASQMIAELRALIISITDNRPSATLFVASIPPTHNSSRQPKVDAYNDAIPGLVAELAATRNVRFVDMRNLTLADVTAPPADSGVHPNDGGYAKIAAHWHEALVVSGIYENERDSLSSIENLTGTAHGDRLVGDAGANLLSGLDGSDDLRGGAGDDQLDGGAGTDLLAGGTGNDIYIVNTAGDRVIEASSSGNDTVRTAVSYTLAAGSYVETLQYTGTAGATLTGNELANRIEGGTGADKLTGGAGADTLVGKSGSDSYYIDGIDVIVEQSGGGTDTVFVSSNYALGDFLEHLTLGGTAAVDGTGNSIANTINGTEAVNLLRGQGGNDNLYGKGGNDRLEGGDGADLLRGGAGQDTLLGGTGVDRFDWDSLGEAGLGSGRDIVLDFTRGTDKLDLAGIDAKAGTATNDAFSFIGTAVFGGVAGQLRFEHGNDGSPFTLVQGDVNGDAAADFEVQLANGLLPLTSTDFTL
jgi:Ca2+-binding RTX toxin-like protein